MNIHTQLILQGISESARQKKIPFQVFLSRESLVKTLAKSKCRVVLVIATSRIHLDETLAFMKKNELYPVILNAILSNNEYHFSNVRPDFEFPLYKLTKLILGEFPARSAFVGFNKDSNADILRFKGFKAAIDEHKITYSVFPNEGDILACLDNTISDIQKYKNLICVNDTVALLLIRALKKHGHDPWNFNITGYGSMKTGEFSNPTLTTISCDYRSIGFLAVDIFLFLNKKAAVQNIYVTLSSKIVIRNSTHLKMEIADASSDSQTNDSSVDYFGNTAVKKLSAIEDMLIHCNDMDMDVLRGVLNNKTYEEIAESCGVAVNTVKYRMKKLESRLNTKNKKEFCDYLYEYDLAF